MTHVEAGSPAALDGRLRIGDRIVSIGGQRLVNLTRNEAATMIAQAGASVTLSVVHDPAGYARFAI